MRSFSFTSLVLAALYTNKLACAIGEVDLVLDGVPFATRRYGVSVDFSKDNRLTFTLSTNGTKIDSLASVGPGREVNLTEYDYGDFAFHNRGNISEIQLGDWDVKGTVNLDPGLTAKITGNVWWEFDGHINSTAASQAVPIAEISGPATDPFASKFNSNRPTYLKAGYCTGWDQPGRKTFQSTYLRFHFNVHIVKSDAAAPDAKGSVGEKSPVALQLSTSLIITEGCSRNASQKWCETDKTGYELCSNYGA